MNSVERVKAALNHEEPDRVPMFDWLWWQEYDKLVKYVAQKGWYFTEWFEKFKYINQGILHQDILDMSLGPSPEWRKPQIIETGENYRIERDFQGVVRKVVKDPVVGERSWILGPAYKEPVVDSIYWPDPLAPGRTVPLERTIRELEDYDINVFKVCLFVGIYTRSWILRGLEKLSMDFYEHPQFIKDLFKRQTDFTLGGVKATIEAVGDKINGFLIGDDLGHNTQLAFSPAFWKEFFYPEFKRLTDFIHEQGYPAILHCDGNVNAIFNDLAELFDGIHPLEPKAGMDLKVLKEKYGKKTCLIGNIDNVKTLPFGTVKDVRKEVMEKIKIAAPGGGYIMASGHSIGEDVPLANLLAYKETAYEYGWYENLGKKRG